MLELEDTVAAVLLALASLFVAFLLFTGLGARQPHRLPIEAAACKSRTEQNKTKQNTETKKKRKGKWFCIYGLAKFRNSLRKEGRRKEPSRERERGLQSWREGRLWGLLI